MHKRWFQAEEIHCVSSKRDSVCFKQKKLIVFQASEIHCVSSNRDALWLKQKKLVLFQERKTPCVSSRNSLCSKQDNPCLSRDAHVSWPGHTCLLARTHMYFCHLYFGHPSCVSLPKHVCALAKGHLCLLGQDVSQAIYLSEPKHECAACGHETNGKNEEQFEMPNTNFRLLVWPFLHRFPFWSIFGSFSHCV